jgi:hypothetical protein
MRYIAIFLLLANIGYFSWVRYGQQPEATAQTREPRPLINSGLTLVSEYEARLAAQPALNCFTVRNFGSVDDAASFIAEVDDVAYAADLNLTGDPLSPQYRVFLPPASSRGIATIILDSLSETLTAAELEAEIYLITRGILENGIALGVFTELQMAEATRDAVQALGYAPEIEEIPRSTGEIQVQLQLLEQDALGNRLWLDLAVTRPDLSITENLCETIAQGSQFP